MKLLTLCLFISMSSFAQIQVKQVMPSVKVGEVRYFGKFVASLSYSTQGADTLYHLDFLNAKYKVLDDIQSVSFAGGEAASGLYDALKSVFTDEHKKNKDYQLKLTLGTTDALISTERNMGSTSALFLINTGYLYLTEKQVDKLFGKD